MDVQAPFCRAAWICVFPIWGRDEYLNQVDVEIVMDNRYIFLEKPTLYLYWPQWRVGYVQQLLELLLIARIQEYKIFYFVTSLKTTNQLTLAKQMRLCFWSGTLRPRALDSFDFASETTIPINDKLTPHISFIEKLTTRSFYQTAFNSSRTSHSKTDRLCFSSNIFSSREPSKRSSYRY